MERPSLPSGEISPTAGGNCLLPEIIRNEGRVSDRILLANVYFNLGNALINVTEQHENAITAYTNAIQLLPDFGAAYNNLSLALKQNGKRDRAHAVCRQGLAACPDEVAL
jgi:tetratricopeptide (TPR) repeat protein